MGNKSVVILRWALTRITMAAALAACLVPSADAAFTFNPTGGAATIGGFNPGTFSNIESLQFNAGNAVAVGSIPLAVGKTFQLYYQTNLVGLNTASGSVGPIAGLNAANGFQITEVSTFTEVVTSITTSASGTTATFALSAGGPNTTKIYFQDLAAPGAIRADAISGNGFNEGTVILTKTVTANTSNFTDSTQGGGRPTIALNGTSSGTYSGVTTDQGSGTTTVNLSVGPYLSNFFLTPGLVFSSFSTNATLPFSQISPSLALSDPNAPANGIATIVPVVGANNGTSGPSFLLQLSGAAESFAVPEPASVLMTLLGFAGVGAGSLVARRRQAKP